MSEHPNLYSASEIVLVGKTKFKEGYEQGRAELNDGINEIIQFIKDNSFNHKLEYDSFKAIGSSVVICLLEQLKEQN